MGRLIDSSSINNCVMMHKSDWGMFATVIDNIIGDIVMGCPTVEAIPKEQYEARLKADMVAMLEDLKKEMNPIKECEHQIYGKEHWNFVGKCQDVIQQKIDALKEQTDVKV